MTVSAFLSFKHGWDTFRPVTPEQLKTLAAMGVREVLRPYLGILLIGSDIMLLFPQTFFISNVLNAVMILLIMAFSLRAGNKTTALIEIPFLILPLLLIWLKHPMSAK